jgi:transposase
VVFYDLTTIRAEGASVMENDVRHFGMAKEGIIARQFMLGVVQTAEGIPIYHEVFDGNVAETRTLLPTLTEVLNRFPSVRRLILVADRGLLSLDNLDALKQVRLANGQALEFIIAVPGRRYNEFREELDTFHRSQCEKATEPVIAEQAWREMRLVVAHDPVNAAVQTARRSERINALLKQADEWVNKLDDQDAGERQRGRPLSDSGAKARLYHAVAEAHLSRIIKVNLKSEVLRYQVDKKARKLAEMMDGKLLLVSNATDLSAQEVVERYKSLADIERGFKVLKSEIEIGPVYHRLPERIRAHAQICFIALILHRVMRSRLKSANTDLSPERAMERLARIQHHRIQIAQGDPMTGVSTIASEQAEVFSALRVKKPTASKQLSLL